MKTKKINTNNNMPRSASKIMSKRDLLSDVPPFDNPLETMYKYTSFKCTFDILMKNKIYFAKFSQFNDPFDGPITFDLDTPEGRKTFMTNLKKKARESGRYITIDEQEFVANPSEADMLVRKMNEWQKKDSTGFCCLTDTYQSLPMWAHYADNHKGCCLIFDFSKYSSQKSHEDRFPFHCIKEIEYQADPRKYNMDHIWHFYAYKSCEWEYEHEWRAVMFDKNMLPSLSSDPFLYRESNGAGLYPLGDFLCGVILGYNMTDADKKSIKVVARQRGISVQQASPKLYKYGIHLDKVDSKQPS